MAQRSGRQPWWPSSCGARDVASRSRTSSTPDLARPAPVPRPSGIAAALAGIALMMGVTWTERAFRGTACRAASGPALGGSRSAAWRCSTPQVLSSGHGALYACSTCRSRCGTLAAGPAVKAAGLGGLDRLGLPRRPVLRLAVHGRACSAACSPARSTRCPAVARRPARLRGRSA